MANMTRAQAAAVLGKLLEGEIDPWMENAQKALNVAIAALRMDA